MPDIRDLICTAERLDAKGFTRRAATAWRAVASSPDAPDDVRESIWRRFDADAPRYRLAAEEQHDPHAERNRQIMRLLDAGLSRKAIAAQLGVSVHVVYHNTPKAKG